ncbi:hypothetical protein D3C78_1239300 [compost metagenome]
MFADRQPQPGPAITPGHRFAGLGETIEDPRLHGWRDADAVIADADPYLLRATLLGQYLNLKADLAVFSELDRIGQQVAQYLAQVLFSTLQRLS